MTHSIAPSFGFASQSEMLCLKYKRRNWREKYERLPLLPKYGKSSISAVDNVLLLKYGKSRFHCLLLIMYQHEWKMLNGRKTNNSNGEIRKVVKKSVAFFQFTVTNLDGLPSFYGFVGIWLFGYRFCTLKHIVYFLILWNSLVSGTHTVYEDRAPQPPKTTTKN